MIKICTHNVRATLCGNRTSCANFTPVLEFFLNFFPSFITLFTIINVGQEFRRFETTFLTLYCC